jgi:hypothetical protein
MTHVTQVTSQCLLDGAKCRKIIMEETFIFLDNRAPCKVRVGSTDSHHCTLSVAFERIREFLLDDASSFHVSGVTICYHRRCE